MDVGYLTILTVIVRALASLLQYCGLIKTEHLTTDTTFEGKFYALLQKYIEITAIKIIAKVSLPRFFSCSSSVVSVQRSGIEGFQRRLESGAKINRFTSSFTNIQLA